MRSLRLKEEIFYALKRGYRVLDDGSVIGLRGRPLQLGLHGKDKTYLKFSIRDELNVRRVLLVHKFAAFQRFGDVALADGVEIRHVNGCALDNSRDNIVLGTRAQNIADIPPEKRRDHAIRAASHLRRFSDEEVRYMREARAQGCTYAEISTLLGGGVSKSTLSYILGLKVKRKASYIGV